MANAKSRIAKLENELLFRRWFEFERFLEGLTEEQLKELALNWRFPDPPPEPLPWGMSRLDNLDRKTLLRLWEEDERHTSRLVHEMKAHNKEEFRFYLEHSHWPEQCCSEACSRRQHNGCIETDEARFLNRFPPSR